MDIKFEEYTVSDFLNKSLPYFRDIPINSAIRGGVKYYTEINICMETCITNTVDNSNNHLVIPYLFYISIFVNNTMIYVYGRTFEDLYCFLEFFYIKYIEYYMRKDINLYIPIYVYDLHTLYYTLKNKFDIEDIHAVQGTIAYFRIMKFEFRCLKVYTNLNESSIFEGVDEVDNTLIRTPNTNLTDDVFSYARSRVTLLADYLEQIATKQNNSKYSNIPLTQIKLVRMDLSAGARRSFYPIYFPYFHSELEYYILSNAPSGGICDYKEDIVDKVLENVICFDFDAMHISSMYSSDMFPVEFVEYKPLLSQEEYESLVENHAIISRIEYIKLQHKEGYPRIKSDCVDNLISNSRNINKKVNENYIESYRSVTLCTTDCDYRVIKNFYNYEKFRAKDCYIYKRGYLPKSIVNVISKYFIARGKSKTRAEDETSKIANNACFGIMDTKPTKVYDTFDGLYTHKAKALEGDEIDKALQKYNDKLTQEGTYTCYHWGQYIAAISRYKISNFIAKACELGIWDYSDTDSVYAETDNDNIDEYLNYISEENKKQHKLNLELYNSQRRSGCEFRYKKDNGKVKEMGIFSFDKLCTYFKVACRKEYIYTTEEGFFTRMSGVSKDKVNKLLKNGNPYIIFGKNKTLKGVKPEPKLIKEQPKEVIDLNGDIYNNEFNLGLYKGYEDFKINNMEVLYG